MIPQPSTVESKGVSVPKRERVPGRHLAVLELWATTTLTQREIAKKVGFSVTVVPPIIQRARRQGAELVKRGDVLRGDALRQGKPGSAAKRKGRLAETANRIAAQRDEARERVLEAFERTGLPKAQLAALLSMRRTTVINILLAARDRGCERYARGLQLATERLEAGKAARATAKREAAAARRESTSPAMPPEKALALAPALAPAAYALPGAVYDPAWTKSAGVPLKVTAAGVLGPGGELRCPPAVARVFERVAAGGLHGAELLAACGVKGGLCARSFAAGWRPQLAAIGIQLNSRGDAMSMTRA